MRAAQKLAFELSGLPTLVMIARSPYRGAHASIIQLRARPPGHELSAASKENASPRSNASPSTAAAMMTPTSAQRSPMRSVQPLAAAAAAAAGGESPQCRLDAALAKSPQRTAAGERVERQLQNVNARLAAGAGAACGDRDRSASKNISHRNWRTFCFCSRNVWITSSLGALLAQPPTPEELVCATRGDLRSRKSHLAAFVAATRSEFSSTTWGS